MKDESEVKKIFFYKFMENHLKKVSSGVFFIFLFSVFGAFVSYLIRFILTANLTPAEYGLFYSCIALVGLFSLLKDFGLTSSLVYYISKFRAERKREKIKTSVITTFVIQSLPAMIIATILIIFANFFAANYLHLADVYIGSLIIKILAIAFFVNIPFSIIHSIFKGFQKMKLFAISEFTRLLSWFIFTYLFILYNYSAVSPAFGFLISYIFVILMFLPFTAKLIPKVKFSFNKELTKKLILYGFPVMLSSAAGVVIGYTDTILITIFKGLEDVGIYQTAQPTARLLWFFAGAFATVLFPLVTELKTKKKINDLEIGISLIYKYIWIIVIPFSLMAFSFSDEILNLFFGSFYSQGSYVLKILAIGAIVFSIVQINGTVINGLGKPKNYTKIVYIGAIVNLVGNLVLIPKTGINGAAISTLLTYIIMLFFSFNELKKFVKIRVPVSDWIKTLVCGLIALGIVYVLKDIIVANVFIEVFVCFVGSVGTFMVLLVLLKVIDVKEIIGLVKQIIKK